MKYHLNILLIFYFGLSFSQSPILFDSKIYFEDGAGNKDTIEIGYDTIANTNYNPGLGEIDLTSEFKSPFEVRASHFKNWEINPDKCILSKRIISSSEKTRDIVDSSKICFASEGIVFFIKTKYQPVKISWDQSLYLENSSSCIGNSFFTPDYNYHVTDPWTWIHWSDKRFACAGKENNFWVNLNQSYIDTAYKYEYTFKTQRQWPTGLKDTILGVEMYFEINSDFSPCQLITKLENSKAISKENDLFQFYPNPVEDWISIKTTDGILSIEIFDQYGKCIRQFDFKNKNQNDLRVCVENLIRGNYIIKLINQDKRIFYKRFVKG